MDCMFLLDISCIPLILYFLRTFQLDILYMLMKLSPQGLGCISQHNITCISMNLRLHTNLVDMLHTYLVLLHLQQTMQFLLDILYMMMLSPMSTFLQDMFCTMMPLMMNMFLLCNLYIATIPILNMFQLRMKDILSLQQLNMFQLNN